MSTKYDPGLVCGAPCKIKDGKPTDTCKNKMPCKLGSHVKWHDEQRAAFEQAQAAAQPAGEDKDKDKGKKGKRTRAEPPKPVVVPAVVAPAPSVKPAEDALASLFPPEAPKPPTPDQPAPVVEEEPVTPITWQAKVRDWVADKRPVIIIAGIAVFVIALLIWSPWKSSDDQAAPASGDESAKVEGNKGKEGGDKTVPPPEKPEAKTAKTTEIGLRWDSCPATDASAVSTLGKLQEEVSVSVVDGKVYLFWKSNAEWGKDFAQIPTADCEVGKKVWKDVPIPR